MTICTAFMRFSAWSRERLPIAVTWSPALAAFSSKPEARVREGGASSTVHSPSAASTLSTACGLPMKISVIVPVSSNFSSSAQAQPWWARVGEVNNTLAARPAVNARREIQKSVMNLLRIAPPFGHHSAAQVD
jgi:hypothetical protein